MAATRFLFWNMNRKPLAQLVADLAAIHGTDVIILAECAVDPATMLQTLNRSAAGFHFPYGISERIRVFTRFSGEFLQPTNETERVAIRRLTLPAREPVILAAAHLPSKLHWSAESQSFECGRL